MHEHSLAKDIVRRVLEEVDGQGCVTSLRILIGEGEHIDPETLSVAISVASADTAAEGAAVEFRRMTGSGVLLTTVDIQEEDKCA